MESTHQTDAGDPAPALQRDVVVVGASAGGVQALEELVCGFPAELGAAIFVVLHVMPGATSVLPQILQRRTQLLCTAARSGDVIERGRIYVAPPDHHMLLQDGHVVLTHGPRENGHRPAVDPLFRSAARAFGPRVIGIVLSGALDDGAAGLRMIAESGGCALVQDPDDALYPSMPRAALDYAHNARAMPVSTMATEICEIIDRPVTDPQTAASSSSLTAEPELDPPDEPEGTLTDLTCPECGGSLWDVDENGVRRFRCHVGHAYSAGALDVSQSEALESALWGALRSLQERGRLFHRLSRRAGGHDRYARKAAEAAAHAQVLRAFIERVGRAPGESDEADVPADAEA